MTAEPPNEERPDDRDPIAAAQAGLKTVSESANAVVDSLAQRDLRQVGVAAFVVGVVLHIGVACAVLSGGDGASDDRQPGSLPVATSVAALATPTATVLMDRTSCEAIRGTDYRSEAERTWFRNNCNIVAP